MSEANRKPKVDRVRIYVGEDDDWYIAAFADNGREIFRSSEGYTDRDYAVEVATDSWPNADLRIEEPDLS